MGLRPAAKDCKGKKRLYTDANDASRNEHGTTGTNALVRDDSPESEAD